MKRSISLVGLPSIQNINTRPPLRWHLNIDSKRQSYSWECSVPCYSNWQIFVQNGKYPPTDTLKLKLKLERCILSKWQIFVQSRKYLSACWNFKVKVKSNVEKMHASRIDKSLSKMENVCLPATDSSKSKLKLMLKRCTLLKLTNLCPKWKISVCPLKLESFRRRASPPNCQPTKNTLLKITLLENTLWTICSWKIHYWKKNTF